MANATNALMQGDSRRRFTDKLARLSVTGGGLVVLFALLLIFFYLAYVVLPLFKSPEVTVNKALDLTFHQQPAQLGVDENGQLGFRYSQSGALTIFSLEGKDKVVMRQQLTDSPTSFFAQHTTAGITAYGLSDGSVVFHRLRFISHYTDGKRSFTPDIKMLGSVQLSLVKKPITQLSFSDHNDARIIAGLSGDQIHVLVEKGDVETLRTVIDSDPSAKILVTPNGRKLFELVGNNLNVYAISSSGVQRRESVDIDLVTGHKPTGMALLAGGHSLLIRLDNGTIGQWFDVVKAKARSMTLAREFPTVKGDLAVEAHRNVFANLAPDGVLSLWHAPSESRDVFDFPQLASSVDMMAFSPRADRLLIEQQGRLDLLTVDNPHPDVSIRSLWQQIWYEGYSEPDYVWQSTSGNESFEGKLSVVPIVFGTIKVAAFSLIFAVPLAIGGAIYTAYFMPSRLRKVVKPTIEIMEALPTVILGFLAGLWLAPIIEKNLPAVFLIFVSLPISFLLVALVWAELPKKWRRKIPDGGHLFLLIPLILSLGYLAFIVGPYIEQHFLGGDSRVFVTDVLGVNFDQRNAIVVGLAMGFAVIPTIFTIAEDAIFSVPSHLTNGSLALGATHWQTLTRVVLLTASPGIFSAIMMGLGRAVGETMIVLMATGNTQLMEWNPFEGLRTLSANIAVEMPESEVGSSHYRVLFLTAFILFSFTFLFNTVAEFVRQRLRDKYRAL
ncbi:ABC transporter permease subunit [Enterovibrio nigricans]|uniref:Phosphate transport system permease protein n=1 Tax=Enterovibrio nigricans DSM 22720 TaxID=1121868 RepID=A0A1T4V0K1_9GAMM|nr:ABC transporter permease subunit [Enterovibrio nigricans]PKF50587.1 phosphate ABC transporter permease [Enterovibrio nigricans]SKA58378.1 phosphate transport system permease protein [Enterovibrio nigricans DSM 22720]